MNETVARAYGRVNLIGEHTDYNNGWVLPTAIRQFTEVRLTPTISQSVIIRSTDGRGTSFTLGEEKKTDTWVDYFQGTTKVLSEFLKKQDQALNGFKANIHSTIPEGSGLSSSAALEISLLKAIREAYKLKISDIDLALLGQKIENEFVGAKVGIMDQMACTLAAEGEALFLDTRDLVYERIKLPLHKMDLLIINSGISHRLSDGDGGYNQRRAECEEAARLLGVSSLREVSLAQLQNKNLPEKISKRATHVVSENLRVLEAVKALRIEDLEALGKLFIASHLSMKNDYEVSTPEMDLLVELCRQESSVYGARLTGGGFGGSIVAITRKDQSSDVAKEVIHAYKKRTGIQATVLSA